MRLVLRQLLFFVIAGTAGFLVDTGVLYLLIGSLGLYWGRVVSFLAATFSTWVVNRHFTFGHKTSKTSLGNEFARYTVFVLGGGVINFITYSMLVARFELVADYPVIGVAAGSLVGMVVNFLLLKYLLFNFDKSSA